MRAILVNLNRIYLFSTNGHRPNQNGARFLGAPHQGVATNQFNVHQHVPQVTGNAGGSHHLHLSSSRTPKGGLPALLREMGTGLLVTELMGQGVNYVTGDYSRGAFGYWVEGGEIQYPVEEITIAGNLRDMLMNIELIGSDVLVRGTKEVGSILIGSMTIGGK
jgi:PmbA protein